MFSLGWQEFILIAFVLVLVVGPKDLPRVLKNFKKFMHQARQMAREFTQSIEDAASDTPLHDVKKIAQDVTSEVKSGHAWLTGEELESDLHMTKAKAKPPSKKPTQKTARPKISKKNKIKGGRTDG